MKQSTLLPINKNDTTIIKGIGILLIMVHNFFHWVRPNTGVNDFYFNTTNFDRLCGDIVRYPSEIINTFFDFMGHYALGLFFFISAYGLTISWLKKSNINFSDFIRKRFSKVYIPFLLSIVIILFWFLVNNIGLSFKVFQSIFYKILLVSNFIKGEQFSVNGSWWFLVAIIQFYLLFPLIMKGYKKYGNILLFVIILLSFAFRYARIVYPALFHFVPFSFIPFLMEISLGIYLASIKELKINKKLLVSIVSISFFVFIAGNFFYIAWLFNSISFLIIFLFGFLYIRELLSTNKLLYKVLFYFGTMSYFIALTHSPLRAPLVTYAATASAYTKIIYAVVFVLLALVFANILKTMEKKLLEWWDIRKYIIKQYISPKNNDFFLKFSHLMVFLILLVGFLYCFELLFISNIFPNYNFTLKYLIYNFEMLVIAFPVICFFCFFFLFFFQKITYWFVSIIFLGYALTINFSVVQTFSEYQTSLIIKYLYLFSPLLILLFVIYISVNKMQFLKKIKNKLSVFIFAALFCTSLLTFLYQGSFKKVEKKFLNYFSATKSEKILNCFTGKPIEVKEEDDDDEDYELTMQK